MDRTYLQTADTVFFSIFISHSCAYMRAGNQSKDEVTSMATSIDTKAGRLLRDWIMRGICYRALGKIMLNLGRRPGFFTGRLRSLRHRRCDGAPETHVACRQSGRGPRRVNRFARCSIWCASLFGRVADMVGPQADLRPSKSWFSPAGAIALGAFSPRNIWWLIGISFHSRHRNWR